MIYIVVLDGILIYSLGYMLTMKLPANRKKTPDEWIGLVLMLVGISHHIYAAWDVFGHLFQ